jgi:hypothetical protein
VKSPSIDTTVPAVEAATTTPVLRVRSRIEGGPIGRGPNPPITGCAIKP